MKENDGREREREREDNEAKTRRMVRKWLRYPLGISTSVESIARYFRK
jgi:hypothetical protein